MLGDCARWNGNPGRMMKVNQVYSELHYLPFAGRYPRLEVGA